MRNVIETALLALAIVLVLAGAWVTHLGLFLMVLGVATSRLATLVRKVQ